jgi:hypothetical protein
MPGALTVEAIDQAASILFSKTTGTGTRPGEFVVCWEPSMKCGS